MRWFIGHDLFKCNLCIFESGSGDNVKEHRIDHINQSKEDQNIYLGEEEMPKKRLVDEYDDDGNYIGDDSCFMDSESEIEDDN